MDLTHRILERLEKCPGASLGGTREQLRARTQQLLLEWDRENARLEAEAKKRLLARGRRLAEGSREWDLALADEMFRAYQDLLGHGE